MDSGVLERNFRKTVWPKGRRIVRVSQAAWLTGHSEAWIRKAPQFDPTFPVRVKIGPHASGFFEDELDEWIQNRQRQEAADTAEPDKPAEPDPVKKKKRARFAE
jgi:predicted DNA-binding transcriptional regulator AlpA